MTFKEAAMDLVFGTNDFYNSWGDMNKVERGANGIGIGFSGLSFGSHTYKLV